MTWIVFRSENWCFTRELPLWLLNSIRTFIQVDLARLLNWHWPALCRVTTESYSYSIRGIIISHSWLIWPNIDWTCQQFILVELSRDEGNACPSQRCIISKLAGPVWLGVSIIIFSVGLSGSLLVGLCWWKWFDYHSASWFRSNCRPHRGFSLLRHVSRAWCDLPTLCLAPFRPFVLAYVVSVCSSPSLSLSLSFFLL